MLSPETIEKIQKLSEKQQQSLIDQLGREVLQADLAVKSEGVSLVDLEQYKSHRDNMRGSYSTDSISEFHTYCKEQLDTFEQFPVFVNGPEMQAKAIIDYGDASLPGHCRFNASVILERTALYNALLTKMHEIRYSQRDMAELLEEYAPHVQVIVETPEGKEPAALPKALAAIRSMSVDNIRNVSSEQNNYSESASVLEKQSVNANSMKPVAFTFTCVPYNELIERTFMVRMSPITRDGISFSLKVLTLEEMKEDIAQEFKDKLNDGFSDTEVKTFMGNYNPNR